MKSRVDVYVTGVPYNWWDLTWEKMKAIFTKEKDILWVHHFDVELVIEHSCPTVEIQILTNNGTKVRHSILEELDAFISKTFPDYLVRILVDEI